VAEAPIAGLPLAVMPPIRGLHVKVHSFLEEISLEDLPLVGGKNASPGELRRELGALHLKVPDGFAVTAEAYWYLLDQVGLRGRIEELLEGLGKEDVAELARRGQLPHAKEQERS
jgi:pyruvate, water dikinase